jgi:D-aminoacyl-tRNA deacylase
MKAILQRVSRGSVAVDGECVAEIGDGYVALVGVKNGDTPEDARQLARKTLALRVFADAEGRMNRSVQDIDGAILAVSQFTLYADTRKGCRPGFSRAASPAGALPIYREYVERLRGEMGVERVKTGVFGATMRVALCNEGPVTVEISTDQMKS